MKRTTRLISALILSLSVLSFGVSAADAPMGSLLPDNVTGFGTSTPSSPIDGIVPGTDMTVSAPSTPVSSAPAASSGTAAPSDTDSSSQTQKTEPSKAVNELSVNFALASNGAKYQTVRLSADKKDEEEISEYFGGTDDAGNIRLNDGEYGETESALKSVAVGGSGRTFRFKFDLGTRRTGISRIVFKNIQDSYSADPLNNRSFDEAKFAVKAGDTVSDMKDVPFTVTKKQLGDNAFSFDVTLETPEGTEGRYFYIEAGPVENAFVLSVDEIQIFGSAEKGAETSESIATTPETGDKNTSGYAFITLMASVATAAVILYKRKRTAKKKFYD